MNDDEQVAEHFFDTACSLSNLQVETVPLLLKALYWQNKAIIDLMKGNRT